MAVVLSAGVLSYPASASPPGHDHLGPDREGPRTYSAEEEVQPIVQSSEEALREDARAYAKDYGVSLEEAIRRLSLQVNAHDAAQVARDTAGARFAGAWIEHEPAYRVVIRLTGIEPADDPVGFALMQLQVPVELTYGARFTAGEMEGALKVLDSMLSLWPRTTRWLDIRAGTLVVGGAEPSRETQELINDRIGIPVEFRPSGTYLPTHTYGGAKLRIGTTTECTSGFTMRHPGTGVVGVLTSGHCPNSLNYLQPGTTTNYALTLRGERADDHKDAQWMTGSHVVYPQFWDGDSLRNQQKNVARLDMPGDYVCHYGGRTGYSCGTVQTIHFDPGDLCGFDENDPCAATWVQVQGPNLACFGGDSGGPWFNANLMYGLQTHGSSGGTQPGQCNGATFMSLGFLSEMNIETLKAP